VFFAIFLFSNIPIFGIKFLLLENILLVAYNGCGLAKVAIFTTNADAENQTLINHKCICGALNRHFWVGAVTTSTC
jgi:hypothetical protein